MPVTGCTWRSSPNAPGCWDRGEPPRPVRVGHSPPHGRQPAPQGWEPFPLEPVAPSSAWPLLASVWGPEVVVGGRRWCSWRTSGSGCYGCPTLGRRGWGHSARVGTFLCGRGRLARWGTGLLSPTASNAPARKDTHPAAWNVPVDGGRLAGRGVRDARTHLKARDLHPRMPYCRLRCVFGNARARSSARTEWQEDGRVLPRRKPGAVVRTHGMPEDRRGASRRAGLAAPPGLTVIVTTRPHRKDVTGVPGEESLEHQSPAERRGHPSRGAMDHQVLSRRCRHRDWGYLAAAGCCHHSSYQWRL